MCINCHSLRAFISSSIKMKICHDLQHRLLQQRFFIRLIPLNSNLKSARNLFQSTIIVGANLGSRSLGPGPLYKEATIPHSPLRGSKQRPMNLKNPRKMQTIGNTQTDCRGRCKHIYRNFSKPHCENLFSDTESSSPLESFKKP